MNRLQLCQRLKLECADSGSITSTTAQSGSNERIVTWIDQAWLEIQTRRPDWNWMRASALLDSASPLSFTTVAGTARYPLGTGAGTTGITEAAFGSWVGGTFRCYLTATGVADEQELADRSYSYWRDTTMFNANRNVRTRPYEIAIAPDESLCLAPMPAAGYTITGDYQVAPSAMEDDEDEPTGLPARFHMLIVYLAMTSYGGRETAPEVTTRGAVMFDRMIRQLELLELPVTTLAGALA